MSTRRWRAALWGGTLLVFAVIMWQARHALLPFGLGAVVAYALSPLVDRLATLVPAHTRRADVWRRGLAVLLIYVIFVSAVAAATFALVPIAVDQINQFIGELPHIVNAARDQIVDWLAEYQRRTPPELQDRVNRLVENSAVTIANTAASWVERSLGALTQTLALLFGFAIVPFWMFYVMRDRHFVTTNIMRAVPPEAHDDVHHVVRMSDHLLGRYIRAQLLLGLVVGTSVGLVMTLLGVQLSLGLGLWAGLTELIPIIGPWLGAVPGIVVVVATHRALLPWVMLAYFIVQQVENNLLVPRVQGKALDLHPAVVILLLAVGGAVWGFIGLIVVIPVTAILRELFWYADRRLRGRTPEQAFAGSHVGGRQEDMPLDARLDAPAALGGVADPAD